MISVLFFFRMNEDEMIELYLGPVDDEVDRPSVQQQRPTNPSTPTSSNQAMRIILEEDENSDSPPAE